MSCKPESCSYSLMKFFSMLLCMILGIFGIVLMIYSHYKKTSTPKVWFVESLNHISYVRQTFSVDFRNRWYLTYLRRFYCKFLTTRDSGDYILGFKLEIQVLVVSHTPTRNNLIKGYIREVTHIPINVQISLRRGVEPSCSKSRPLNFSYLLDMYII